jgi:predicted transcriptional regulator
MTEAGSQFLASLFPVIADSRKVGTAITSVNVGPEMTMQPARGMLSRRERQAKGLARLNCKGYVAATLLFSYQDILKVITSSKF